MNFDTGQQFEPDNDPDPFKGLDDICRAEVDRIVAAHNFHCAKLATLKASQAELEAQVDRLVALGQFHYVNPSPETVQVCVELQRLRVAIAQCWIVLAALKDRIGEFILV